MDVDPELDHPTKVPIPHDVLWYPDGDVVLATDSLLFKVHKFILSLQSSVFKDMFDLPTGVGIQMDGTGIVPETYEGVPFVTLVGDKGEDVAHLLRTAYERQYYHRDDVNTPLDIITALLLLSTKYDFQHIRSDVILQISKQYPTTLADYDDVDANDYSLMFGTYRETCHYPLLKAAFATNSDVLLPVLYYACSDYDMDIILSKADILGSECMHTLIKGKVALEHAMKNLVTVLPDELLRGTVVCPADNSCPVVARFTGLTSYGFSSDLKDFEGHRLVKKSLRGACAGCAKLFGARINGKRQNIWERVPLYFEFTGWDEVRRELAELC